MSARKIVSFNIRCPWVDDGINSLPHRLGAILNKIDELDGTNERLLKYYRENIENMGKCDIIIS